MLGVYKSDPHKNTDNPKRNDSRPTERTRNRIRRYFKTIEPKKPERECLFPVVSRLRRRQIAVFRDAEITESIRSVFPDIASSKRRSFRCDDATMRKAPRPPGESSAKYRSSYPKSCAAATNRPPDCNRRRARIRKYTVLPSR